MGGFYTVRTELRQMPRRDVLNLASQKKTEWCNVGAKECGLLIQYKSINFCLTELPGKGCCPDLKFEDQTESKETSLGQGAKGET